MTAPKPNGGTVDVKIRLYSYSAFGEPLETPALFNGLNPTTGAVEAGTDLPSTKKDGISYTGHFFDKESKLIYAKARFIDPSSGRFLTRDPIQDPSLRYSPAGLQVYVYGLNNPTTYWDPDGQFFILDDIAAAVVGAAVNVFRAISMGDIGLGDILLAAFTGAASGVANLYTMSLGGGTTVDLLATTKHFSAGAGNIFVGSAGIHGGFEDGGSFGFHGSLGAGGDVVNVGFNSSVTFSNINGMGSGKQGFMTGSAGFSIGGGKNGFSVGYSGGINFSSNGVEGVYSNIGLNIGGVGVSFGITNNTNGSTTFSTGVDVGMYGLHGTVGVNVTTYAGGYSVTPTAGAYVNSGEMNSAIMTAYWNGQYSQAKASEAQRTVETQERRMMSKGASIEAPPISRNGNENTVVNNDIRNNNRSKVNPNDYAGYGSTSGTNKSENKATIDSNGNLKLKDNGMIISSVAIKGLATGAGLSEAEAIALITRGGIYAIAAMVLLATPSDSVQTTTSTTERTRENNRNIVYHATDSKGFIELVKKLGSSVIDTSVSKKDNRFGQGFYVAYDEHTARMEFAGIFDAEKYATALILKFRVSDTARILDLTESDMAKQLGYKPPISLKDDSYAYTQYIGNLIRDFKAYDAIRFPSKYTGVPNLVIFNPTILIPVVK